MREVLLNAGLMYEPLAVFLNDGFVSVKPLLTMGLCVHVGFVPVTRSWVTVCGAAPRDQPEVSSSPRGTE